MKLVVVDRLEIIECVHAKGRGQDTLVSLRADGRTSYTISLAGPRHPSSGGPSVVAYLDPGMKTLHAWLDPASGEYFVANLHMPGPAFFASILLALLAVATVILLRLDPDWLGLVLAGFFLGSCIAFARQQIANRRLEPVLRAALAARRQQAP